MAALISLTPDNTAEIDSKWASAESAIILAKVVFPTPGGPHRIIECGIPLVIASFKGLP